MAAATFGTLRGPGTCISLLAATLMAAAPNWSEAQTTHGVDSPGRAGGRWSEPGRAAQRLGSNPYQALPWNERGYDARSDVRIQNDPFADRRTRSGADGRTETERERSDFQQFNAARQQGGFDRMDWDVPDRGFNDRPRSDFGRRWSSAYRGESGDGFGPRDREGFETGRRTDRNFRRRSGGFETSRWDDDAANSGAGRRFGETDRMGGWERGLQDGDTGRRRADWDTRERFGEFDARARFGGAGRGFDRDFPGAATGDSFDGGQRSISGQAAAQFGSGDFGPQDAGPGRRGFGPSAMGRSAIDGGYRGGLGRSGVNPSGLSGSGFGRSRIGDGFDSGIGGDFGRGGLGQSGLGGPGTASGFGGTTTGGPSSGLGGTGFGGSGIGSSSGFGDGGIGGPGLGGSGFSGSGVGGSGAGGTGGTGGR